MPARRSLEAMEKDARAADLFRCGATYRQIAAAIGWASPKSAFEAVRRAAKDAAADPLAAAEAMTLMLDRIQDRRRLVYEALQVTCYATSASGDVVCHPETGEPLIDISPVFRGAAELRHEDELEAKLRGLYAPVKSQVKVITEDAIDEECARLTEEIAEHDRARSGAS